MKNKTKLTYLVLLLILGIGIGYAALTSNLKILGQSGIKSGSWIIYFDKVRNESGVVSTNTEITHNKTQVDFNIQLNEPGDYYEFDVDTVNDGTIDAMIDSVEFGDIDDSLKDVITFDVTYKDGTKIKKCDVLEKESRKAITVKVYYKLDISKEQIIDEEQAMNLTFTINYVQNTECDNRPTLVVDPNGGSYNGTTELTNMLVERNSDTILDQPTREGYEFLYFKASDGTKLTKDAKGKTTVHVDDDDEKVTAYWQEEVQIPKYVLTIDPNGGFYNAYETPTTLDLAEGETLTLEDPIRDGYIFDSWEETTETSSLDGSVVTMPALAVTVRAVWKTEADYVARIEQRYYTTIQKAFDAAVTNDKVWLLKSTTENATNVKDISFDLGGFTVTGTITNSGTLTIDNGKITNTESSPFVNTGTVNVGTKGGEMVPDSIIIDAGRNINGLTQNGTFNFYDGHIIGKNAVTGIYNELEEGYYYIVDGYDDDNTNEHWQKAYLTDELDAIVKKVIDNRDVYYKLLQDAVDASSNDNPNIYAIDNFRDSHRTTIGENDIIVLDIAGFNVEEGAAIINNGTFTIKDSKEEKGSMTVREPVVNNKTLTITDLTLSQVDNGKNLLENSGDLNITNSTLTSTDKYALDIKTGGNLIFDNNTTIKADSYGIYNEAEEAVTITGGNIVGIYNNGNNLTVNNSNLSDSNKYKEQSAIYNKIGKLYLNNLTLTVSEYGYGVNGSKNSEIINITGGTYTKNYYNCALITIPGGTSEIRNAVLTGSTGSGLIDNSGNTSLYNNTLTSIYSGESITNYSTLNIYSGTFTSSNTIISRNYGNIYIHDGNLSSKNLAIDVGQGRVYIYGGTISSTNGCAIVKENETRAVLEINGGTISSSADYAIVTDKYNLNITGGTISSTQTAALYNKGDGVIKGGTLQGKTYGVYNTGTLRIGEDDTEIKVDVPVIIGETFGVYTIGNFYFYDGVLEGKTDGYNGIITEMPKGYDIAKSQITINEETYTKAYLVEKKDFLQVDSETFNSFQDAIDSISTEGTIEVIDDTSTTEAATIPSTKTITLDMKGHEISTTKTINNSGTLKVKDSIGNSKLSSYNTNLFYNEKNLTFLSGNYQSNYSVVSQYNSNAKLNIDGGYFLSTNNTTINNNEGTVTVTDGEIEKNTDTYNSNNIYGGLNGNVVIKGGYIHSVGDNIFTKGFTTISGGRVYSNSGRAVYGKFTISGGEVYSKYDTAAYASNYGTCTINGGNIHSDSGNAVIEDYSNIIINDGTINSISNDAINGTASREIIVNGGTITSNTKSGILRQSSGSLTITGGTVTGKTYGVYLNTSTGLILGTLEGDVSKISPVIIGEQEGIHVKNGYFKFYDGIVKGIDNSYSGTVTVIEDGYYVKDDTETIDNIVYKTSYLEPETDFLEVNGNTFNSLQKAIDSIETTGTINVIENKNMTTLATIPSGKNITLDIKGKTLSTSQAIINTGTLTVKDSLETGKFSCTSLDSSLFQNQGTLNIENGNYETTYRFIYDNTNSTSINISDTTLKTGARAIYSKNTTLTIDNLSVKSTVEEINVNTIELSGGTATITSSNIDSKNYGVFSTNTALTIEDTTITSEKVALGGSGTINLTNSNITSTGLNAIRVDGTMNIYSGNYISTASRCIDNYGTLNIYGGLIKGRGYGIDDRASLTLGADDNTISTEKPVIIGTTYAISNSNTNTPVNFYDGVLKGKTDTSTVQIVNIAANSIINYGTETDENDEVYNIAYLINEVDIVENQTSHQRYKNLNTAISQANSGETLQFINNATIYYDVEVDNKTITLDLNSKKINSVKPITNNGNLSIVDDSQDKDNLIETNYNISVIKNNNKLSISDTAISTSILNQYMIQNTTSGAELSLDNVTINSTYSIDNTGTLNINNSNISAVKNNTGNVLVDDSTITTFANALYNYNGVLSVTNSNVTTTTRSGSVYYAYYNNVTDENISKNTIDKSNLYSGAYGKSLYNVNGTLEIKNLSNVYNGFENNSTLNILNSYITHTSNNLVSNTGTLTINNSTTEYDIFNNSGTTTINDSTINCNKTGGNSTFISNSGNMTFNNNTINSTNTENIINNTNILNINSSNIIANAVSTRNITGIVNSGTAILNSGSIKLKNASTAYGLYLTGGSVNVKNFEINVYDSDNSYGIYVTNGAVTIGELEDPISLSTTTPSITAIGTTTGIGIKKTSGQTYYYDGVITGSTEAIPEAPTAIPNGHRIILQSLPNDNNYDIRILERVQN